MAPNSRRYKGYAALVPPKLSVSVSAPLLTVLLQAQAVAPLVINGPEELRPSLRNSNSGDFATNREGDLEVTTERSVGITEP